MTWNQILHTDGRGRAWDFLNPDPAAIDWPTIALVLARIPRFNGHTTQGPYSVAQHLVEGARAILRDGYVHEVAAAYLLHDAHEFVIGDDVRPKVEALASLASQAARADYGTISVQSDSMQFFASKWIKDAFRELKSRADAVIYPAAGLAWPLSSECAEIVKQFDNRMLRTEADARTGPRCQAWADVVESAQSVEGADCSPWSADLAASLWLSLAKEILPALQSDAPASPGECECCEPGSPNGADAFAYTLSDVPRRVANRQTPITVLSGERQDEQRYGNKRTFPRLDSAGVRGAKAQSKKDLGHDQSPALDVGHGPNATEVRDWCDWADGGRPGTCTACGGVFGMLYAPSTCHRVGKR